MKNSISNSNSMQRPYAKDKLQERTKEFRDFKCREDIKIEL